MLLLLLLAPALLPPRAALPPHALACGPARSARAPFAFAPRGGRGGVRMAEWMPPDLPPRGSPGHKRARLRFLLRRTFQPRKVAAERRAYEKEVEERERAERRAATIKAFEEEQARQKAAAEAAEAERVAAEKIAAEAAAIAAEERRLAAILAQEKKEAEKAAKLKAEEEARAKARAKLEALKAAANKMAAEEQAAAEKAAKERELAERAAAEKAAAEEAAAKLEAEKLAAAIEAAKTPEERAAEAAKKAAEEEKAKERAAAEELSKKLATEAAASEREAAKDLRVTELRAAPPAAPAAPYVRVKPATPESTLKLIAELTADLEQPRLLSFADVDAQRATALKESLAELEASFTQPTVQELREQLLGFWRMKITSSAGHAASGLSGCASQARRTVLGTFQCFKEQDDSGLPTMQTVEVISDSKVGRSAIAALKGDFYVGKLAGSGLVGVVEEYTKLELDNIRQNEELDAFRWTCVYLDDELRVCRVEKTEETEEALYVFQKEESQAAQNEIARLMELPVDLVEGVDEEEEEEEDDRPLWQRRLDAERDDGDGRTSEIP